MAVVYAAEDLEFEGSRVAIKQLICPPVAPADRALLEEAFVREAQTLRGLKHQFIPRVYACFSAHGDHFLVMDLLSGRTLDTFVDLDNASGRPAFAPTVMAVLSWSLQVCEALVYLHAQKPHPVIHKDIKPQNLMLTAEGVMLLDFGIAKATDPRGRYRTIVEGVATPGYAAPEMYLAQGTSDPRVDIYALGATIYALLGGRTPIESIVRQSELLAARPDPLPPLRSLRPDVPAYVEGALQRMVEVRVEQRFATATAARRSLATCREWIRKGLP